MTVNLSWNFLTHQHSGQQEWNKKVFDKETCLGEKGHDAVLGKDRPEEGSKEI
jgi:hypothetical protein